MKKILVFLIPIFIGCTTNSNVDELIKKQQDFLMSTYHADLSSCEIRYIINETKNKVLYGQVKLLDDNYSSIRIQTIKGEFRDNALEQLVNDYWKVINELNIADNIRSIIELQRDYLSLKFKEVATFNEIERNLLVNNLDAFHSYVLRKIIERSKEGEYVLNKLYPVVIEESNVVNKGDVYSARILMAGFDSTRTPIIKVNGMRLNVENGEGKMQISTSTQGEKKWTADVEWLHENTGLIRVFHIEEDFIVK